MGQSKGDQPLAEYVFKLMLLETIRCHRQGNPEALKWIEDQMFKMTSRWKELNRRDKK